MGGGRGQATFLPPPPPYHAPDILLCFLKRTIVTVTTPASPLFLSLSLSLFLLSIQKENFSKDMGFFSTFEE